MKKPSMCCYLELYLPNYYFAIFIVMFKMTISYDICSQINIIHNKSCQLWIEFQKEYLNSRSLNHRLASNYRLSGYLC